MCYVIELYRVAERISVFYSNQWTVCEKPTGKDENP
jgi:hypothetical protein